MPHLLTPIGLKRFVHDVHLAYLNAETIYAVVRMHDIDDLWWGLVIEAIRSEEKKTRDGHVVARDVTDFRRLTGKAWDAYFKPPHSVKGDTPKLTFYESLTRHPQSYTNNGAPIPDAPQTTEKRKIKAHFVSPLPSWDDHDSDDEERRKARHFAAWLGLAWELIVIGRVKHEVDGSSEIKAWVSRPLCWAHATDKKVLQIIYANTLRDSYVQRVADTSDPKETQNVLDRNFSRDVIDSMQNEIRTYADRGSSAEDYLLSIFAQTYFTAYPRDNAAEGVMLEMVLNKLGMAAWTLRAWKEHDVEPRFLETVALEVFTQFLKGSRASSMLASRAGASKDETPMLAKDLIWGIL
jgi:hypothetical protein